MNIINVLSQNLNRGSRTRTPDDAVPYPAGYRGRLIHAEALCTTCGTCVYACSPGAITIDATTTDASAASIVRWKYTEDRCTFCGYCVQYCPTQALSFEPLAPAPITERAQHYTSHDIPLQPCRKCGKLFRAIPEAALFRLYGDPLPVDIAAARELCEQCRQQTASEQFFKALAAVRGDDDD